MQRDKEGTHPEGDISPDREERIQDFLGRHGGAGSTPRRAGKAVSGEGGWYEVYAADGHKLRCDWTRLGEREELKFSEVAPPAGGPD